MRSAAGALHAGICTPVSHHRGIDEFHANLKKESEYF